MSNLTAQQQRDLSRNKIGTYFGDIKEVKHQHKLIHRGEWDECECGVEVECPMLYGAECRGGFKSK